MPSAGEETVRVQREFFNVARFPKVIGAIDGTQIPIKGPPHNEGDYVNRKGFHSINVQIFKMLRAKRVKYNPEDMKRAIELVHNGMAKKKAAHLCGVPRSTLQDKIAGRVPQEATRPGPKTVLTPAEEEVLVSYIDLMADVGYPVGRQELNHEVKKVLDKDNRSTPFKNNMPGKDWFQGFLRRHPSVAERKPQPLGKQRAGITQEMLQGWFDGVVNYLRKEIPQYEVMLNDPRRIFNADESGFPLCITSKRVLATTGCKNVYQVVNGSKTQITVMACFNANGDFMPPMIVYPGQRLRNIDIDQFPSAIFGNSQKGWMDSDLFVEFLKYLSDFVKENGITLPVMLFVDGHATHMSLDAAEFCHNHKIILYCLLPNATHLLQPCDIGLFSPLKTAWQSQVKAWQLDHIGETITKSNFPGIFKNAWDRVTTIQNASHGFRRSGLFPLSPKSVDHTKLGPAKLHSATPLKCTPSPASTCTTSTGSAADVELGSSDGLKQDTSPGHKEKDCAISKPPSKLSVSEPEPSCSEPRTLCLPPLTQPRHPDYVSPSFNCLSVPTPKEKTSNIIRAKMPKAISGHEAIKMLKAKYEKKVEEESKKAERKRQRETKKKEKEIERERKQRKREEERKNKENQKPKKAKRNSLKRKLENESDSDASESEIRVDDSESGEEEVTCKKCARCETESEDPGIVCCLCDKFWHITCTGVDVTESDEFYCDLCTM